MKIDGIFSGVWMEQLTLDQGQERGFPLKKGGIGFCENKSQFKQHALDFSMMEMVTGAVLAVSAHIATVRTARGVHPCQAMPCVIYEVDRLKPPSMVGYPLPAVKSSRSEYLRSQVFGRV